jgi:hypothetical protein
LNFSGFFGKEVYCIVGKGICSVVESQRELAASSTKGIPRRLLAPHRFSTATPLLERRQNETATTTTLIFGGSKRAFPTGKGDASGGKAIIWKI